MNEHRRYSSRGPPNTPSYLNLASAHTTVHTDNKPRIQNGRMTKSQHTSVQLNGRKASTGELPARQTGGKHLKHSLNLSHMEVIQQLQPFYLRGKSFRYDAILMEPERSSDATRAPSVNQISVVRSHQHPRYSGTSETRQNVN
jgi:hypothetical protein